MIGAFLPLHDGPKSPGWIIDGNGCHVWVGTKNSHGYGQWQDKKSGRWFMAHRLRYEREVGPIPEGMQLDHFVCENRSCCNPRHVRPVTQRENVLRGETIVAGAAARTHCSKGHPLSRDNLDSNSLRHGRRRCLICLRDRRRRRDRRRKVQAAFERGGW